MASSGSKVQSNIRSKKKRHREKSSSLLPMSSSFRSSSPPLFAKHEKSVYVRVLNLHGQLEWYSFVFNGSGEDEKRKRGLRSFGDRIPVITPYKAKKRSPSSGRCVVVGSTIYSVGRESRSLRRCDRRFSKRVYRWDTSLPKQSWEKATRMINARCNPEVVALNGKIYAFGGTKDCDSKSWAEVFDPASGNWAPLVSPSPKPTEGDLFVVSFHDRNEVMVGSIGDDFHYTYDVSTKLWKMSSDVVMNYEPFFLKPVTVDTTLFWFQDSMLHAYDFGSKSHFSTNVRGLEKHIPLAKLDYDICEPILVNLADTEFILICLEDLGVKRHVTLLHCIGFWVSKYAVRGRGEVALNACVQSSQTYVVNRQSLFLDAMLIDTGDSPQKRHSLCRLWAEFLPNY